MKQRNLIHIAAVPNAEGQRCLRCCEKIADAARFEPGKEVLLTPNGIQVSPISGGQQSCFRIGKGRPRKAEVAQ